LLKAVLDAALTVRQRAQGLTLDEPDDHLLVLRYRGEPVAYFSSAVVTIQTIRLVADRILEERR